MDLNIWHQQVFKKDFKGFKGCTHSVMLSWNKEAQHEPFLVSFLSSRAVLCVLP